MSGLGDIKNSRLIIIKGLLFLVLGVVASAMLVATMPRIETIVLLSITVWAFCRFYFFAFYVIEHYIDASHKFDGLYATFLYLLRRFRSKQVDEDDQRG